MTNNVPATPLLRARNGGINLDAITLRLIQCEAERLGVSRSAIVRMIVRNALLPRDADA